LHADAVVHHSLTAQTTVTSTFIASSKTTATSTSTIKVPGSSDVQEVSQTNEWLTPAMFEGKSQKLVQQSLELAKVKLSTAAAQPQMTNLESNIIVHATPGGLGSLSKHFYRFQNVRMTRDALYVHLPPGIDPPPDHWVDFISANTTSPLPPTMLVIKGDVHHQKWYYMPVKYVSSSQPAPCRGFVDKPTYFLQVRYSYNIWHTWNEGLMGAFQTFRELGYLPLVQIDDEGNMREVLEGMGGERCLPIVDPVTKAVTIPSHCPAKTGVLLERKCDIKNQAWCRPGVVSYQRDADPIILPYTAASVVNVWAHMYDAMTKDVRDFSLLDGACYKELIFGKTNTLNFYQAQNVTANPIAADAMQARVDAMAVFKEFVMTAQRNYVQQDRIKSPGKAEWQGYRIPRMERLRRGIGPERAFRAEEIMPRNLGGLADSELDELKQLWNKAEIKREGQVEEARMEASVEALDASLNVAGARNQTALLAIAALLTEQQVEESTDGGMAGKGMRNQDGDSGGILLMGGPDEDLKNRPFTGDADSDDAKTAKANHGELNLDKDEDEQMIMNNNNVDDDDDDDSSGESRDGGSSSLQHHAIVKSNRRLLNNNSGSVVDVDDDDDDDEDEALEQQNQLIRSLAESTSLTNTNAFRLESPRPVVTYMCRNTFSRAVLNEHEILKYILSRYNVTLRVTTFEEPLLTVMETLSTSDVLLGMHGAGWTNGLFLKRGAASLQMFPYGWRLADGSTVRGYNYREIVLASETKYFEWVNPNRHHAFFRRIDFSKRWHLEYKLHGDPTWPLPSNSWPGNPWIYQNTYVDMKEFGPLIDDMMAAVGIGKMTELQVAKAMAESDKYARLAGVNLEVKMKEAAASGTQVDEDQLDDGGDL
jgi:hypothetical protein